MTPNKKGPPAGASAEAGERLGQLQDTPGESLGPEPRSPTPLPSDSNPGDNGPLRQSGDLATALPTAPTGIPDLEALRLSQDFASQVEVAQVLVTVPVRRPSPQWFVRTHPGEDYRLPTAVLRLEDDAETYLVAPDLAAGLPDEVRRVLLVTAITRTGTIFLWPIKLPGEDGRLDNWNRSAQEIAQLAESRWVRLRSNRQLGAYVPLVASGQIPEPEWPDVTMQAIVEIAFRDRYIADVDHPIIQALRGRL